MGRKLVGWSRRRSHEDITMQCLSRKAVEQMERDREFLAKNPPQPEPGVDLGLVSAKAILGMGGC